MNQNNAKHLAEEEDFLLRLLLKAAGVTAPAWAAAESTVSRSAGLRSARRWAFFEAFSQT